jgi:hypothetical protein
MIIIIVMTTILLQVLHNNSNNNNKCGLWLVASASSRGIFLHAISFVSRMEEEREIKIVST